MLNNISLYILLLNCFYMKTIILYFFIFYIFSFCKNNQNIFRNYFSKYIYSNPISIPEVNGFLLLTESSLDEAFQLYKKLFIIFIASYDEQNFLSIYKELLKEKIFDFYNIKIGKIDPIYHPNVLKRFKLYGWPHKILFNDYGKNQFYFKGHDTRIEIVNFLKKNNDDPLINIKTKQQLNNYIKNNLYSLIFFGNNEEYIKLIREKSKNDYLREYAIVENYDLYNNLNNIKNNTLMFISPYDDKLYYLYNNEINENNINNLIKNNSYPLIMFDIDLIEKAYKERNKMLFIVRNNEDNEIDFFFAKISKSLKGQLIFAFIYKNYKSSQNILKEINFPYPNINIQITIFDNGKYYLNESFTEKKFINFLNKYLDGEFYKIYKSEEIPINQNNSIYKIVAKNLYKEVIRNDKDVFLKVYSPKCGHCNVMKKDWIKLGNAFYNIKNDIRIAEINLLLNDFKLCKIGIYPGLFFFKNGSKGKIIRYNGKHYFEDFKKFVIENSSRKLIDNGDFVSLNMN